MILFVCKYSRGLLSSSAPPSPSISDECVEDDETFHLQLSTEDESVMLNPATAYVTIHNNDCKFSIDCLVVIEKGSKYRTYRLVARIATCTHT